MPKNSYILEFKSKGTKKAKDDIDKLDQSQKKLGISAGTLKKGLGIAGIAIAALGTKAISTAAQFETLRTRLNTMYGSISRGTKAFQTFNKVAATTPFAVKDVVTAGASLKAFGMDAEDTIKQVADLAAFMGTDIVDAANAMGRAFAGGAGAADVLRDKGILQLIKDMKGLDDLTKLTLPEFRTALTDALSDPAIGIAGSTDALAETFEGNFSNMMDAVDRLAAKMGDKLLPATRGLVQGITAMLNTMIGGEDATQAQITQLKAEEHQIRILASSIMNLDLPQEERIKKIRALQKEYPDFLANMKAEEVTNNDIARSLSSLNQETQIKINKLIQERILNKVYEEQKKLVDDVIDGYDRLNNQTINFGKEATKVSKELDKNGNSFSKAYGKGEEFRGMLSSSDDAILSNQKAYKALVKESADLYKQYVDGDMTLKEYTQSVEDLVEKEEYRSLNFGKELKISESIDKKNETLLEQNANLSASYKESADRIKTVTDNINELSDAQELIQMQQDAGIPVDIGFDVADPPSISSEGLQPVDVPDAVIPTIDLSEYGTEFDAAILSIRESMTNQITALQEELGELTLMDMVYGSDDERTSKIAKITAELEKLQGEIKKIPKTTEEASQESMSNLSKMSAGINDIWKGFGASIMDGNSELWGAIVEGGALMVGGDVDNKKKQLEAEKYTVVAQTAAGLINIWAKGGFTPWEIAQKSIMSAVLIGKSHKSVREIDKAISELGNVDNTKTGFHAQYGMDEIVSDPTPILAGEAGAERVTITPLGEEVSSQGMTINVSGNVLSKDYVRGELKEDLREAIRQGHGF